MQDTISTSLLTLLRRATPAQRAAIERMAERIVAGACGENGTAGEGGIARSATWEGDAVAMLARIEKKVDGLVASVRLPEKEPLAEAVTSAVGVTIPEFLIIQEGTRQRRGKYDRTVVPIWRIRFRGHDVLMPPWAGTDYLVHLMFHQGEEFAGDKLKEAVRKSMPGGATGNSHMASEILHGQDGTGNDPREARGRIGRLNEPDLMWNEREIATCLWKMKELVGEIKEHEDAGDDNSGDYIALKENLEAQQDLLRANAKQVNGKWVPKAYQKGTLNQMADTIRKAVREVLDEHLRENCRLLFDHLNDREVLVYGVNNSYNPKPRVNWRIQLKGDKTGM